MTNSTLLGALRRRWWLVLIVAVLGAVAGAIPEPEKVEELERTFTATHTLLTNDTDTSQAGNTVISPNQVSLFVTTGEVPSRAADEIDYTGNAATLASQVTSVYDFTTGALTITTTQNDADRAELVADTFADELTAYLAERQDVIYQERLAAALDRLSELEIALTELTRDLARNEGDPVLQAQQSAVSRQYSVAFEQSELLAASPPVLGFTTLQRAQAVEVTDRGIGAPRSRQSRAILGGVVGLAVGTVIALLLSQLDRRIRTREQAEELLDLRGKVLIPKVRDPQRDRIVVVPGRHDPLSDAYRTVRNVVDFVQSHDGAADDRAPVTLVVSPGPGDGKTSLAANLAAAIGEHGKRTILVNADFRRPRLSKTFGREAEDPLPFLFDDLATLNVRALLTKTGLDRMRLLDLSSVDAPAGELVRATERHLEELRRLADAVVIDTSPVGATAEVLDLVPFATTIVMVVRVGHTRVADAQRSIAILRDLAEAPILLVLTGLKAEQVGYYEYDDRRKGPPPKKRRFWRRKPHHEFVPAAPDDLPAPQLVE